MSFEVPSEIAGLRVHPLEIDKHSRLVDDRQVTRLRAAVADEAVTDLLVLSHGWNNDKDDALALYRQLIAAIGTALAGRMDDRTFAVVAVFWPSKRFADDELIPGGAASLDTDVPEHLLRDQLAELHGFFAADGADAVLDELEALVPRLEHETAAREAFAEGVRRLLDPTAIDDEVAEEMPPGLFTMPGAELIEELAAPRPEEVAAGGPPGVGGVGGPGGGDAASGGQGGIAAAPTGGIAAVGATRAPGVADDAGGAASLRGLASGIRSGARNAMNLITYYTMKDRAGDAGRHALAPVLQSLRDDAPDLRLHLIGHSFGGRLIAGAALGPDGEPPLPVDSLTLLQAAFSHHGFSRDYLPGKHGYFHGVIADARVAGPIVITHTRNDRATTWAYPVASRAARQRAATFGGPDDIYGAIGTNGALATPGAVAGRLLPADATYDLRAGAVHNLEASDHIASHSDITGAEVANAIAAAVEAT